MLISFPLQLWLHERNAVLPYMYIACLISFVEVYANLNSQLFLLVLCVCVCVCVCSLGGEQAQFIRHIILPSVACPAAPYFSTLSHKRHDFPKIVVEHHVCVLIFCTRCVWNIFLSKKNWARCGQIFILLSMYSTSYSCTILMRLQLSRHISENSSNTKFYEHLYEGGRIVTCGRTTRPIDTWRSLK